MEMMMVMCLSWMGFQLDLYLVEVSAGQLVLMDRLLLPRHHCRSYESATPNTDMQEQADTAAQEQGTICVPFAYAIGKCKKGSNCPLLHIPREDSGRRNANRAMPVGAHTAEQVPVTTAPQLLTHEAPPPPLDTAEPVSVPASAPQHVHTATPAMEGKQNEEQQTLISSRDWSPEDDNIEVTLPYSTTTPASREDVDRHIDSVLYAPRPKGKTRLDAFTKYCPE